MLNNVANGLRWAAEMMRPPQGARWFSAHTQVLDLPQARLLEFDSGAHAADDRRLPRLFDPPFAGHGSDICDYAQGQSLVEAALASRRGRVLAIDWKSATLDRKDDDIDDYIAALDRCVDAAGGKVHLIGLCQGGWESAVYAALRPSKVASLTLAGAPIDFRACEDGIQSVVDRLGMEFYEGLVAAGGGLLRGAHMLLGWKLMNPVARFVQDPLDLYWNINDPAYVERSRRFRDWYDTTVDLPGRFYLRVVRELFVENAIVKGNFRVCGERVDLADIRCPVAVLTGTEDDITLEPQATALLGAISSVATAHWSAQAGHVGVFMKRQVVQDQWPVALDWAAKAARETRVSVAQGGQRAFEWAEGTEESPEAGRENAGGLPAADGEAAGDAAVASGGERILH